MGILLCEQNFRDVWRRNKSVLPEIGQILRTHTLGSISSRDVNTLWFGTVSFDSCSRFILCLYCFVHYDNNPTYEVANKLICILYPVSLVNLPSTPNRVNAMVNFQITIAPVMLGTGVVIDMARGIIHKKYAGLDFKLTTT